MAEKKKTASFNKAMRSLNSIEVYYAKMICNFSNETRLKIYRKLAALMPRAFAAYESAYYQRRQKPERTDGDCFGKLG